MKWLAPVLALTLLGPGSLAAQDDTEAAEAGDGTEHVVVNGRRIQDRQALPLSAPGVPHESDGAEYGPVINPDVRCETTLATASGEEGESEFRRNPAGPDAPPLTNAVDYEIGGCDMIVSAGGRRVHNLPELPDSPAIIPAQ